MSSGTDRGKIESRTGFDSYVDDESVSSKVVRWEGRRV